MNPTLVTTTQAVDKAFYVIFGICGVALAGVAVAMLLLVWRYNRKRQPQPLSQKDHNLWLEVIWTAIPTALVMLMFWYGWEGYLSLRRIPDNAMHIKASARMWSWLFTYGNGKTAGTLYVPVGQPVKIELTAEDVLHSFYVPAFRVKRDTVPGMTNWVWFVAEKAGSYDLFCAEYCGVGHSKMVTTVEALPAGDFQTWLTAVPTSADAGKALLQKHGCLGCHSLDGTRLVGPTFQGISGRQVEATVAGQPQKLVANQDYLKESIVAPAKVLVNGYPPTMPSFEGRISDVELAAIVDYLLTLTATPGTPSPPKHATTGENEHVEPAAPHAAGDAERPGTSAGKVAALSMRGKELAGNLGCLGCHSVDGSRRVGPSFKGLFGSPTTVTRNGHEVTVTADTAYLTRAIREPTAEVVVGYPPAMPPFAGLTDTEVAALIIWIESLQ